MADKLYNVAEFPRFSRSCPYRWERDRKDEYSCIHSSMSVSEVVDEDGCYYVPCTCLNCPFGYRADANDLDDPEIAWGENTPSEAELDDTVYIVIQTRPEKYERPVPIDRLDAWNRYNEDVHPERESELRCLNANLKHLLSDLCLNETVAEKIYEKIWPAVEFYAGERLEEYKSERRLRELLGQVLEERLS